MVGTRGGDMGPPFKSGTITVTRGKPLVFEASPDAPSATQQEGATREQSPILESIKAYRDAIRGLVEGTFRDVAPRLPRHLRGPCNTFILRCSDGVIVRTDAAEDEPKARYATTEKALQEVAPWLSETVLHFPADLTKFDPADHGAHIQMDVVNFVTGASRPIASTRFLVVASSKWPDTVQLPKPPARPPTLVSLVNEITLHMEGSVEPVERQVREVAPSEQFLAYGRARLPALGWEAIDVYPLLSDDYWNPGLAPSWAERDLYAWLAQVNATGVDLATLDGRGAARKHYAGLLAEFGALLAGEREEPVHQFLKSHPELLCPGHDRCWSKVPFGDRVSDFVFREPWNDYLLVELEAPHRELFRADGQQREQLTHALNQITDWIQHIQNNRERVETDLGLQGISTNPRCMVVIGRSTALDDADRRKLATIQAQNNKLRILTYDDVLATARAHLERAFGPLGMEGENVEFYFYRDDARPR
jgi:hypothetical protein